MKNLFKETPYKKRYRLGNIKHKRISKQYVLEVIDYCKGYLKKYLKSFMTKSGHAETEGKWVYIPDFAIKVILTEIEYFKKNKPKFCDIREEYYSSCAIHNSQPDVIKRPNLRYEWNGNKKQWLISKERMQKMHNENRLEYSKNGIPRIKRYLKEMNGIPITDTWLDIPTIQNGEKIDYATQKPIKLIERIIEMFSNEGDLVLDCFAGSGTTGLVAMKMNRNFILIDKNKKGKRIFEERIKGCELKKKELKKPNKN